MYKYSTNFRRKYINFKVQVMMITMIQEMSLKSQPNVF